MNIFSGSESSYWHIFCPILTLTSYGSANRERIALYLQRLFVLGKVEHRFLVKGEDYTDAFMIMVLPRWAIALLIAEDLKLDVNSKEVVDVMRDSADVGEIVNEVDGAMEEYAYWRGEFERLKK
jgi:hypothetical protein